MSVTFRNTLSSLTLSSAVFSGAFTVCASGEGLLPFSVVATSAVPTPTFSVSNWDTYTSLSIRLSPFLDGASIFYTTDGTAPDLSSTKYDLAVRLDRPTLIRAVAIHPTLGSSAVAEQFIEVNVPPVTYGFSNGSVSSTTHHAPLTVNLSVPFENLDIYFTLDDTEPTENSTKYEGQPLVFTTGAVLRTLVVPREAGWRQTAAVRRIINIRTPGPTFVCGPEIGEPVHFTQGPSGPPIHYTLDRTTPTLDSPIWTGPLTLPQDAYIRILLKNEGESEYTDNFDLKLYKSISTTPVSVRKVGGEFPTHPPDVALAPDGTVYTHSDGAIYRVGETSSERLWPYAGAVDAMSVSMPLQFHFLKRSSVESPGSSITTFTRSTGAITARNSSLLAYDLYATEQGDIIHSSKELRQFRMITPANENLLFAGSGQHPQLVEGGYAAASFPGPGGITYQPGQAFYLTEHNHHRIRKVTAIPGSPRMVSSIAGDNIRGVLDGPVALAQLYYPDSITVDRLGNIYFTDRHFYSVGTTRVPYHLIRKLTPEGWISRLGGPLVAADGSVIKANAFEDEVFRGIEIDAKGDLYVASSTGVYRVTQDDWDNDGLPDEMERQLGAPFVVGVDDRTVDSDGDGISNAAEWIAKTNPKDAADKPAGNSWVRVVEDSVHVCFSATPGSERQMEYSVDMKSWMPLGSASTSSQSTHTARDQIYPNMPARFYRLKETR